MTRIIAILGITAVLGVLGVVGSGWASLPVLAYVGAGLFYVAHFGGKLADKVTEVVRGA